MNANRAVKKLKDELDDAETRATEVSKVTIVTIKSFQNHSLKRFISNLDEGSLEYYNSRKWLTSCKKVDFFLGSFKKMPFFLRLV